MWRRSDVTAKTTSCADQFKGSLASLVTAGQSHALNSGTMETAVRPSFIHTYWTPDPHPVMSFTQKRRKIGLLFNGGFKLCQLTGCGESFLHAVAGPVLFFQAALLPPGHVLSVGSIQTLNCLRPQCDWITESFRPLFQIMLKQGNKSERNYAIIRFRCFFYQNN